MSRCFLKKGIILILAFIAPLITKAAVPEWKIVPNESTITFTATQNNAPVTGKFNLFDGEISFDPNQLNESKVLVKVKMSSVSTSYGAIADILKSADWFDVSKFSQAIFEVKSFSKQNSNKYQADGIITIRNKVSPISSAFILEEYSKSKVRVNGTFIIKRTLFGVGQGDWASTDEISDNVQVNYTFSLLPA